MSKKIIHSRKKKKKTINDIFCLAIDGWVNCNIFNFHKGDSVAYLVLYILIPVIMTAASLNTLLLNNTAIIYCYLSILISVLNGLYDGANRWNSSDEPMHKIKIFIIYVSNVFIGSYCLYIIIYTAMNNKVASRFDWILFAYFATILVAITDAVACFVREIVLANSVKGEDG